MYRFKIYGIDNSEKAMKMFCKDLIREKVLEQCDWCTCGDVLSIFPDCERCDGTGYFDVTPYKTIIIGRI